MQAMRSSSRDSATSAEPRSQSSEHLSIFDRARRDTYYIAMEFLEGRSLKEMLVRNGPTPVPIAIDYARQILSALAFAHRNGIVHRISNRTTSSCGPMAAQ